MRRSKNWKWVWRWRTKIGIFDDFSVKCGLLSNDVWSIYLKIIKMRCRVWDWKWLLNGCDQLLCLECVCSLSIFAKYWDSSRFCWNALCRSRHVRSVYICSGFPNGCCFVDRAHCLSQWCCCRCSPAMCHKVGKYCYKCSGACACIQCMRVAVWICPVRKLCTANSAEPALGSSVQSTNRCGMVAPNELPLHFNCTAAKMMNFYQDIGPFQTHSVIQSFDGYNLNACDESIGCRSAFHRTHTEDRTRSQLNCPLFRALHCARLCEP